MIQVRTAASATITSDADLALAGSFLINIPSDGQRHTATGNCRFNSDERVFALQPHLQSSGVHASLTRTRGAQQATLIDTDYNLQSQTISQVTAGLQDVQVGDVLTTVCTYVNTSGQTKNYGEAERNEQCFIGRYRTPANVPTNPAAPPIFACAEGMN